MGTLLSVVINFFKNLFSGNLTSIFMMGMLVLLGIILVPNYDKVAGFFGYETREVLKEKVKIAQNNVEVAVAVNKSNVLDSQIMDETIRNTNDVIIEAIKEQKKNDVKVVNILKNREQKLKDIELASKIVIEDITTPQVTKDQIEEQRSSIQITAIWDTYCQFNQSDNCSTNQSPII